MSDSIVFNITPHSYHRMTRFSKFTKETKKYHDFMNRIQWQMKIAKFVPADRLEFKFYLPMPKSWGKRKRETMFLHPHQQKPDIDNFTKAMLDSMFRGLGGDHTVHEIHATKKWAQEGYIEVINLNQQEGRR